MASEIYKLVHSGSDHVILRDVYYEAARKFAIEAGADPNSHVNRGENNSIHFTMNVDGTNYFIYIARHFDGSTYLGINDADVMQREFRARMEK